DVATSQVARRAQELRDGVDDARRVVRSQCDAHGRSVASGGQYRECGGAGRAAASGERLPWPPLRRASSSSLSNPKGTWVNSSPFIAARREGSRPKRVSSESGSVRIWITRARDVEKPPPIARVCVSGDILSGTHLHATPPPA